MRDLNQASEDAQPSSAAQERPALSFRSIVFSDGSLMRLEPTDIVVFVGPNNAGKSAALRELEEHISSRDHGNAKVIREVELNKSGDVKDFIEFISENSLRIMRSSHLYYVGYGYELDASIAGHYWNNSIQDVRSLFCRRIRTDDRIISSNPVSSFRVLEDPPSHPIHILFSDDRVEKRISSYFKAAFGRELIVFKGGGSEIPLLVGSRVPLRGDEDRTSASYVKRLMAECSPLGEQGDGMRSFASVVLQMLALQTPSILLLDEPEAFLHPPQARLLGEFLAKERPAHSQLFISTHSPDILIGLLNAVPDSLRVVRIQREGSINRVTELEKARAKELAEDPLMKYSAVLSGVFFERVIICESDADCLFYQAILSQAQVHGGIEPDVLFLHANGKHRMAVLAEALRALGVTVDVIADVDILNERDAFQRLFKTLGGDWGAAEPFWKPLKQAIEARKPSLNGKGIADRISKALDNVGTADEFPADVKREIEAALKMASPWSAIKEAGDAAIPPGEATLQMQRLREMCKPLGLWIVPVGELEGFCKAVGGHGPRWVQQVIEKYDLKEAEELKAAREFASEIWQARRPRP